MAASLAQEAKPKSSTQIDVSAGYMQLNSFELSTNRVDVSHTTSSGRNLRGDFTVNFIVEGSPKQTLKNNFLLGHFDATLASRKAGPVSVTAGAGFAREVILGSRFNAAGPSASVVIANKRVPVFVSARMDIGNVGANWTGYSPYAGVAVDVAASPAKCLTAFTSRRRGFTEENLNATINGLVCNLEAFHRKVPITVTYAHISDRQLVQGKNQLDTKAHMLSVTARVGRARIAR